MKEVKIIRTLTNSYQLYIDGIFVYESKNFVVMANYLIKKEL